VTLLLLKEKLIECNRIAEAGKTILRLNGRGSEHRVDGKVLGKAKWASITKPDDAGSCYLFLCYIDDVLSDSIHESIEDAKNQAEWEYEGISHTW
jgi:hypothetical protein